MEAFSKHTGVVAPLDRVNVDTDAIIPKQFLRKIERTGFGVHLFHEWRYLDYEGTQENPDFILNQGPLRKASVLLTRDNFGCGSSREHAPWALGDFGFRVIIAPSFADIFYNNCVKTGILLVRLSTAQVDTLFQQAATHAPFEITADLEAQTIFGLEGTRFSFEMDAFSKTCLLKGLDQIAWTQQFEDQIKAYEENIKHEHPWLA